MGKIYQCFTKEKTKKLTNNNKHVKKWLNMPVNE
jgi:hypothetical protein